MAGRYTQTGAILWRTSFLRSIGGWSTLTLRYQDIGLVLRAPVGGGARYRHLELVCDLASKCTSANFDVSTDARDDTMARRYWRVPNGVAGGKSSRRQ